MIQKLKNVTMAMAILAIIIFILSPIASADTETINYTYNTMHRLITADYDNPSGQSGAVNYVYDNMGNRLMQTVTPVDSPPNNPPDPVSEPNIQPNETDVPTNSTLSWSGGDPDDGDQVVYYIYFGLKDDMRLVASGTQTSFDPGPLEEKTTYCWQIISIDNHNAVTQGDVWCFTTGVELKEMFTDTSVIQSCDNGEFIFDAVIVAPEGLYDAYFNEIKTTINLIGGDDSEFDEMLYTDTNVPENILETHNVIAVGNMATNAFIRKLYREWYVLLDLKYPGGDGYVVRTLHDPYSTGHNVIFLGGSTDKGVEKAVDKFEELLFEHNFPNQDYPIPCSAMNNISVPRLMEIELDADYALPEIGVDIGLGIDFKYWNIASWRDFYRTNEYMINFGWNPISIAGILYYMTGDEAYLELFKDLAMPDPDNIPLANQNNPAFYDPGNPLVKSYHYHSHLVDLVYDLIEESPELSDEDCQHITNRLLEHQEYLDPDHTLLKENPDRHASYDMLNIYTGSRYFQKYYPDLSWNNNGDPSTTVWEQRIANARASFNSLIGDPTWGESDTLPFVPTYNEVVFDFFMLDGFGTFVTDTDTGYKTAETIMRYFDITRTGLEADGYSTFNLLTMNLLNKAADMLDGNYVWLLKELQFDETNFRIGQSFWHPLADTNPLPADISNQFIDFPLVKTTWENANQYLPEELQIEENEGFQVASFRSGMTKYDDFLQLDGHFGRGRNEMHLNSIYWLRMFGYAETETAGIPILWGYENDVDILYNGLSPLHPPQCTALKTWHYETDENMLYLETQVPNMPESEWKRHILYMKDNATIVIDQITADKPGEFDITCSWSLFKSIFYTDNLPDISTNRSILLSHAGAQDIDIGSAEIDADGNEFREKVKQTMVVELSEGEIITIGNAFSKVGDNSFTIRQVEGHDNAYRLSNGDTHSLVVLGHFEKDGFTVDADFAYYTSEMIFEVNDGAVQTTNQSDPSEFVAMLNNLEIREPQTDEQGEIYIDIKWPEDEININWTPAWQQDLSGDSAVKNFAFLDTADQSYAAVNHEDSSQIFSFSKFTGATFEPIDYNSSILSMQAYQKEATTTVFDLLAGFEDHTLRAYKSDTDDSSIAEVWNVTTEIHEDVLTVHSPWFTTDVPGVYSILVADLWNTDTDIIAAGLPCTVEFLNVNGELIERVKTVYGPNTSLGLLTDVDYYGNVLLAGKKYTGYPLFSGIIRDDNNEYRNISDSLLYSFSSGEDFTAMQRWNQNGIDQMLVDDIDNDGIQEVVYTLSGHWNELRVHTGNILTNYSKHTTPEWLQYFGGGNSREDFMKGLAVISQDDGTKATVTATKHGRVYAFSANGDMLWVRNFRRNITCMEAIGPDSASPKIVVGFENGIITALDKDGNRILNAKLESAAPQVISSDELNLYCGDSNGVLTAFPLTAGHWQFDESEGDIAKDSGIYGNHGTLFNDPQWAADACSNRGALQFDGIDDYVKITHNESLLFENNQISVSFWMKADSFPVAWPVGDIIIVKTDYAGGKWEGFYVDVRQGENNNGRLRLVSGACPDNYKFWTVQVPQGQWTHVGFTIDENECRLYINGKLSDTVGTNSEYTISNNRNLHIGSYIYGDYNYSGLLDDVRIYNYALSQTALANAAFSNDHKGDINGDGTIGLDDAIAALKVLVKITPAGVRSDYITSGADVNGDCRVGSEEVLYILEVISEIRQP